MPLLRTWTLDCRTPVPLNGSRCQVTRLDVPRGTSSQGTRIAYLPLPVVVGVATMAPAMWKIGVHVRAAVATRTGASLGAIDGKLAAAAALTWTVTLTWTWSSAGTVTLEGYDRVTPAGSVCWSFERLKVIGDDDELYRSNVRVACQSWLTAR